MSNKKSHSKQKLSKSNGSNKDDLKKYIDKNEAQQKVLEKMAEMLKEKKTDKE